MYDAKKLPINEQNKAFEHSLNNINRELASLNKIDEYYARLMQSCVQKILDRVNSIPPGEATEMLEGLSQIITIVCSRVQEVKILTRFIVDPTFVPREALVRMALHPDIEVSCNLTEVLSWHVQKEFRELGLI